MRLIISFILAALMVSCATPPARTQNSYTVVASCGTPPLTLSTGAVRTGYMDTSGQICSVAPAGAGSATAANQVLQIAQETAINTLLGVQADAACATDNGTCTLEALVKRLNQRLTTLNTTLGSPFQAGGSIGNTTFAVTNAGTFVVQATLPTTPTDAAGNGVVINPSTEALAGIVPVVSSALEANHVICAAACNFYGGYITTGATAGWLLLANATSAPTAGGAAIAPIACVLAPANQSTSISGPPAAPIRGSTGIVMVFSTSGCLTNTASTTAFFSGQAK